MLSHEQKNTLSTDRSEFKNIWAAREHRKTELNSMQHNASGLMFLLIFKHIFHELIMKEIRFAMLIKVK